MPTITHPRRLRQFGRSVGDTDDGADCGRTIARPFQLPTGRAIVGGLLVAVSGLGIFAAHRAATVPDRTNWLIIRRPVAAGATIGPDDLALAPMSLAADTRRRAVTDPGDVIGRVALVPLSNGDLVLRSTTAPSAAGAATSGRRVGLSLDPADALGGAVDVGDRVDVVAVPSAGGTAEVIVRGALVGAVDGGADGDRGGVGGSDGLRLILEVPDEDSARRVIEAHAADGVTLIAASTVTLSGQPADGDAP